jgi:hypothetical protein
MTLPRITFDSETVEGGAIKYKYAKLANWEDINVTFYDTIGLLPEIDAWRQRVYTIQTGIGMANFYKRTCAFALLNGQGVDVHTISLYNSWPKEIAFGDLSYTESDAKVVTLTLSYDYAEVTGGGGGLASPSLPSALQ